MGKEDGDRLFVLDFACCDSRNKTVWAIVVGDHQSFLTMS
jgi:hypothetical protein